MRPSSTSLGAKRLSPAPNGSVVYRLRRHWSDGTRAIVFEPLDSMARLAALVLARGPTSSPITECSPPAAQWREWIVPTQPPSPSRDPSQALADRAMEPDHARKRPTWA